MMFNIIFILITIPNVLAQIRCSGSVDCTCQMIRFDMDLSKDTECNSTAFMKIVPTTLPPTTTPSTPPTTTRRSCPAGFEWFQKYCLKLMNASNYYDLEGICYSTLGQHMATSTSVGENVIFSNYFFTKGYVSLDKYFYMGGYNSAAAGSQGWMWNERTPVKMTFFNWDNGQPNMAVTPYDKCLKANYRGFWSTSSCMDSVMGICEAD